jgi:predicted membrane protein
MTGRVFSGLIVLTVGVILLVKELGIYVPHWLLSWPMLLIAIGLFIGFRHSFRGPAWIVLIAVGSIFLIDRIEPIYEMREFLWPIIIIAIGLVMIFRPQKKNRENVWGRKWQDQVTGQVNSSDDVIDSVTIFGGIKRNVISKTFKGGDLTTIFGGSELNLLQADVEGKIILDITQIFAGTKLIVPPHWKVQSDDLVSIFGGIDDKRPILDSVPIDNTRVLVLRGTCIFGGIDIKSF